jgi:hypothetical protein
MQKTSHHRTWCNNISHTDTGGIVHRCLMRKKTGDCILPRYATIVALCCTNGAKASAMSHGECISLQAKKKRGKEWIAARHCGRGKKIRVHLSMENHGREVLHEERCMLTTRSTIRRQEKSPAIKTGKHSRQRVSAFSSHINKILVAKQNLCSAAIRRFTVQG